MGYSRQDLQRPGFHCWSFEAAVVELRGERNHSECPMATFKSSPVSEKILGLKALLPCSKLIIFVAEFCPSIASYGSSTNHTQQGHLWLCQLPNTLPINVFYISFNELIFIIFSGKTWLELGQIYNCDFFFPLGHKYFAKFYNYKILTVLCFLFCFSSFSLWN